jgi:hypothetical protein
VKNSAIVIGNAARTFCSEPTEGLTRPCSISEIIPLVTPARLASSRWLRANAFLTARSCFPTSILIEPRLFNIINSRQNNQSRRGTASPVDARRECGCTWRLPGTEISAYAGAETSKPARRRAISSNANGNDDSGLRIT